MESLHVSASVIKFHNLEAPLVGQNVFDSFSNFHFDDRGVCLSFIDRKPVYQHTFTCDEAVKLVIALKTNPIWLNQSG